MAQVRAAVAWGRAEGWRQVDFCATQPGVGAGLASRRPKRGPSQVPLSGAFMGHGDCAPESALSESGLAQVTAGSFVRLVPTGEK